MGSESLVVFLSSAIGTGHLEPLGAERAAAEQTLKELRFVEPWRFEEKPADSRPARDVFLSGVRDCDVFVLILGKDVTQPVKDEYYAAAADPQRPVLVFVKADAPSQDPEMRMSDAAKSFLSEIRRTRKYKPFATPADLQTELRSALLSLMVDTFRRFRRTPASRKTSEGADQVILMVGAGELGQEIARSLRRYSGNRVVLEGIDRYATPPARDELHSLVVLRDLPWSQEALLNAIDTLSPRPDKILPELMAFPPGLFEALAMRKYVTIPAAGLIERLVDRISYRTHLDDFLRRRKDVANRLSLLGVKLPRWRQVSRQDDIHAALGEFGGTLLLKPKVTDLGLGQSLLRGSNPHIAEEVSAAWAALRHARYGGHHDAIVEEFVPLDSELYQVVVGGTETAVALEAVEYGRNVSDRDEIGGPWQLDYSVQPAVLAGRSGTERDSVLARVREASLVLGREWLNEDGFFGFEYLLAGEDIWLNKITFRPDINGMVTVYSSRPSIFDVYAKFILGHRISADARITPAACCPKLWPDHPGAGAQHRFVIRNTEEIRGANVEVFPIDKYETNARDRVAFIVAWAGSGWEALQIARAKRDAAVAEESP